jgi:hypothetical protein
LLRGIDLDGVVLNTMAPASRRPSAIGLTHRFRPTPHRHVTAVGRQDNLSHSTPRLPGRAVPRKAIRDIVLHERQKRRPDVTARREGLPDERLSCRLLK